MQLPLIEEHSAERMSSKTPLWKRIFLVFIPALVIFVVLDILFITFVVGDAFKDALGDLMRPSPDPVSGVLAWLCILGAVYFYGLSRNQTLLDAFTKGAGVGLGIYGTYELTNYSIISSWGVKMVLMDMAWGSFACGLAAATMHHLQSLL